jgi:hypothetical protein
MIQVNENALKIAVDFDGTIVENNYPRIGREMMFAFATMKELQKKGHLLILWTFRTGRLLDEAVEYCRAQGIEFYAVNESFPGELESGSFPRKLNVDLFIDDRNVGGFIGWSKVWQLLSPGDPDMALLHPDAHRNFPGTKRSLFGFRKRR